MLAASCYNLDWAKKKKLKSGRNTLRGIDLVDKVKPLCAMNLLLQDIGSEANGQILESGLPVVTKDAPAVQV